MIGVECFLSCIVESGLVYPLMGLITITAILLFMYIFKRNYESLLASQSTLTVIISVNLFSMNCDMFTWVWIYLGIILIGTLLMGLVKHYLELQLDRNIIRSPPYLSEIKKKFKVDISVLDTQKIKAFTYKNRIYLSVGLLERLEKDEIMAVVAHEVYHLNHSPNKLLSSLLALTSLTFRRFNDEHYADQYAVKTAGIHNLINALKKLEIRDYKKRAMKLSA
ncbi:MAG: M48 family metalloprotease [Thermoplasmatales archaeon]|nr:MAG: M48 family metalloprotease [Thermoplasmatales archaeon]